ncbi:MAG: bifunctional aspartate kinase/homoserine dehydrogenase I [Bacteroidota bacterium]
MKILKFGGSSVAHPESIERVTQIINSYLSSGEKFGVVVSALGGLTDVLEQMGSMAELGNDGYKPLIDVFFQRHTAIIQQLIPEEKQAKVTKEIDKRTKELTNILQGVYLIKELTPRTKDYLLSFGERCSAFLLSKVLWYQGVNASMLDAREVLRADNTFGKGKIKVKESYQLIQEYFKETDELKVITGFIASTARGETITLGRGGSDYTASLFGAALGCSVIEIWTDVAGVMTADPNKVKKALPVKHLSYQEALEMSHFGAKVIYPATVIPAMEKNIPLYIKSTFAPEEVGTVVSEHAEPDEHPIKGISSISDVSLIMIQGGALVGAVASHTYRLFRVLANYQVNIILITQGSSEHNICFAVKPEDVDTAKKAIEEEFSLEIQSRYIDPLIIEPEISILAVIGDNMKHRPGISARLFQSLGKNGVNVAVTSQGSSERNISVAINRKDEVKALNAVHEAFFLSDTYSVNLYIVGVGLIGGTLLSQIRENAGFLHKNQHLEINVVGLANSKRMVFDEEGIVLENWREHLNESESKMDIRKFVAKMKELNLRNSIFVDNTAAPEITEFYEEILDASISISTPNKFAPSGLFRSYQDLKYLAYERGVKFMYETNVGAGLPVITTISDLVSSGDRILKIQGVLSGSLSYIFNTFQRGEASFSDIVLEAQQKGFTEPDPREDLCGSDVARKLTILARESGVALERENIRIDPILSPNCIEAQSVEAFFEELKKEDERFEQMRESLTSEGKALRYIATLAGDQAFLSLAEVGTESDFYHLSGSDNMIVFTTERYKERPLVIKGPGAGAEVTAAGVLAEIIRIAYHLS